MGFSGGGGSASGVSAHVHNSLAGEGGSLDTTSLINDTSLYTLLVAL